MSEQETPEPILPPSFTFSQTSLQDYFDCQRRFQLRYIEHLSWPSIETEPLIENEHRQQEGQLFHRMVQQERIGLPVDKLARMANSPELSRWWDNYSRYQFELEGYTQYTELILSVPFQSYRLVAKYDLVAIEPEKQAFIFDWKTYHKRPKDERMAVRLQTRLYRTILVLAGDLLNGGKPIQPKKVEMIYWYADFPTQPLRLPYQESQFKRDWNAITGMIDVISKQTIFPLTDDVKKCSFCTFRSYCERGEKAGNLDNLETGLDDAVEFNVNFEQIAEIEF